VGVTREPARGIRIALQHGLGHGRPHLLYESVAQNAKLRRQLVRRHGLTHESGVLVLSVEKGSPAERSELREGDVIVSLAGHPVAGVDDLHKLLTGNAIGVRTSIALLRNSELVTLDVEPSPAPTRS
jgi:S1-C subfamily serine protease